MIFGRFLSNSSFHCAVSRPIRFFSANPGFDFGCVRGPDDAIVLFQRMVEMHPIPPVIQFTKLLSAVVKMRHFTLALHLFDAMLRREVHVNDYTLSIAINCFCLLKRAYFGLFILGSVLKRGYEPDVVTFNTLLKGLFLMGKMDEAEKLLKNMVAHEIYPDVVMNTCVDAFCKQGDVKTAENILKLMIEIDVQPNIITYNALIKGYCSRGEMDRARNKFDAVVNSGLKPDTVSYSSMVDGYCKRGRVDDVLHLFTEIPTQGLEYDVVSYSIMLHAIFGAGKFEEGLKLFKEMEESLRLSPDKVTYTILVDRLCSAHYIYEAFANNGR